MSQLEHNLRRSFAEVKKEILEVKNQVLKLAEGLEKIEVVVSELKAKKTVKKSSGRKR